MKKFSIVKRIVTICITLVAVLSVSAVFIINAHMNKINYIEDKFEYLTEEDLQSELDIGDIESEEKPELDDSLNLELDKEPAKPDFEFKEGITNILLIGADKQGTDGYGRSDTIMILTLDTNNKTIKMSSVLRDCYVSIPGYKKNKINASYAYGGPDLLIETLQENLGIKLDKYIYIDFKEFKNIINTLGGVKVNLTKAEVKRIYGSGFEEGEYLLNGKDALHYVRIRKIDSDFGRTNRQRTVLTSLYNDFKDKSIPEMVPIVTELLQYINTNMTKTEILDLVKTALTIGNLEIEQHTVPAENTYTFATTTSGASIIRVDFEKNSKLLYEFIYGELPEESTVSGNSVSENTPQANEANSEANETTEITSEAISEATEITSEASETTPLPEINTIKDTKYSLEINETTIQNMEEIK